MHPCLRFHHQSRAHFWKSHFTEKCFTPSVLLYCPPSFFMSTLFLPEWKTGPAFSDLGSADVFCQAFLLSVRNQGISLSSFMPRDNTIQGYHTKGQRGQGEKAAAKLETILVARELKQGRAWMGPLNVRHSLLGLEDHPKERRKCKSNHTWEGMPELCQNNVCVSMTVGLLQFKIVFFMQV